MKVTKEVAEMLETKEGQLKLIAIKLCELIEHLKNKNDSDTRSLFKMIFG